MKKPALNLFLGLIILLTASCREHKMLSEIESLLESDPGAAYSALASMPVPSSNSNKALYAILKTQADYKNYVAATSDSLILSATRYYGDKKKDYHAAMAWYSLGCVYSDMNNDLAAINAFIKAKDLFPDTLVRYYALTEQNLGKHYLNQMMLSESKYNMQCCLANSMRLHEDALISNARYHLALNALYAADYQKADTLFSELLNNPLTSSLRSRQCLMNLAKIQLFGYNDSKKAQYYIDRYLYELNDSAEAGVGYSIKGDIFFENGQYDSAYHYYEKSMQCPEELYTICDNSGKLAVLSIYMNNTDDALAYMQLHDELIDSIYDLRKDIAIEQVARSHQLALKDNETRYRHKRYLITGVSLLILFILCYLLWMAHRWNRMAQMQIRQRDEVRNNSIEIMKAHIMDTPFNDKHISRATILNLYKEKLDLCKNLFRETAAYSLLSSKLLNNDSSFSADEKNQIVNQISESFIDSILDMNIEIANLNREDIVICILSSMKFNNRFISEFINISESGVRKRKLRLQEKASKDYLELFI